MSENVCSVRRAGGTNGKGTVFYESLVWCVGGGVSGGKCLYRFYLFFGKGTGYERLLNEIYATVRDNWDADRLMGLGLVAMPEYYGDKSLENIGFALMDLNGDGIDELVVGTSAPVEGANVVFCVYENPVEPFYFINSVEGYTYYLHESEAEGTYTAERMGTDRAFAICPAEEVGVIDFDVLEGAMDPAGRLILEMIPFAHFK